MHHPLADTWIHARAAARRLLACATMTAVGIMPGGGLLAGGDAPAPDAPAALDERILDALKPGEWLEVPHSRLDSVAAPQSSFPWLTGSSGIAGIICCWAGGAFDSQRDQLYIGPGGGHNGYNGNEVYAFSLHTMRWRRMNDPYPVVSGESTDPKTSPSAIHTYDGVEYLPPPVDRYVVVGGWGSPDTYALDPDHPDHWDVYPGHGTQRTGDISGYDPVRQVLWFNTPINGGSLSQWDPLRHQWSLRARNTMDWMDYHTTGDIDSVRSVFAAVGNGHVYAWQLSAVPGAITGGRISTTGDTGILERASPGFCFAPLLGTFVAWSSGADVYTLDVAAKVWTKHPPSATNTVIPGAPDQWGTFGRFRYVASHNAFILCNSVSQNVFFYRLTADQPNLITAVTATLARDSIDSDIPVDDLISVTAAYADGTHAAVTAPASFVSLDPTIAHVDLHGHGTVTGLTGGTARIRVSYTDPAFKRGFSDIVSVRVTDQLAASEFRQLILNAATVTIAAGDHLQMQATRMYSRGGHGFSRRCPPDVMWHSSDQALVTVTDGLVTVMRGGSPVSVTASWGGQTAVTEVMPSAAPLVTRISFQVKDAGPRAGWLGDNGKAYSDERGYGWLSNDGLSPRDDRLGTHNSLLSAFVGTASAREFAVKLPTGSYLVRVAMGDAHYGATPFACRVMCGQQTLLRYSGHGNDVATSQVDGVAGRLVLNVIGPLNYLVITPIGTDLDKYADDGPDP